MAQINSESKIVELIVDKIPVYQSLAYFSQATVFLKTSMSGQDDIFLQEFLYIKYPFANCMSSSMHGYARHYKCVHHFNVFSFASFEAALEDIKGDRLMTKEEAK